MSKSYLNIKSGIYDTDQLHEQLSAYQEIKIANNNDLGEYAIYRIVLSEFVDYDIDVECPIDLYIPKIKELTLLSPKLEIEVNTPGSLEFTMPPFHKYYDLITCMGCIIEVYEGEDIIWFGRPIEVEKDFYNQKKVYCEGALGFFKDSYMSKFGVFHYNQSNDPEVTSVDIINKMQSIFHFFRYILSEHNGSVLYSGEHDNAGRCVTAFLPGDVTIENKKIDPQSNEGFQKCSDIIDQYLIDSLGGYLVPKRAKKVIETTYYDSEDNTVKFIKDPLYLNDNIAEKNEFANHLGLGWYRAGHNCRNVLNWYKDFPFETDGPPVEFGLNLMDISYKFDAQEYCTCVLPQGPIIDYSKGTKVVDMDHWSEVYEGTALTITPVNDGVPVLESEAVKYYGRIIHIKDFELDNPLDVNELKEKALKYLEDTQFNSLTIECKAIDLHYINGNYNKLKLGQMIHVKSVPHLIDRDFPISKMSIELDSSVKQITLGTVPRKTLTRLQEVDNDKLKYQVISADNYIDLNGTANDTMYFVY